MRARILGGFFQRPRVGIPHLCVDRREDAIYWVGSRAGRDGLTPDSWGSIPLDRPGARPEGFAALAASARNHRARVEVSLCSDDLIHRRSDLPELSAREAQTVAARRCEAMRAELDHESRSAWLRRGKGAGAIWYCAAPVSEADPSSAAWEADGFDVHRLHSRHLALGNLAQVLPPPPEGALQAVFDLEQDSGTCVVMDSQGWVFSRQIPLRFMGDRVLKREPEPPASANRTVALELDLAGPSSLLLEGEADAAALLLEDEAKPDETVTADLDPMEQLAGHAERLQTELRRTFGYVRGELGLDHVGRVVLAGESPDLRSLEPMLSEALQMPVVHLCDELPDWLSGVEPGAAVALGMALSPDRHGGNLLAPARVRARAVRAARSKLAGALALASLAFLLLGAHAAFRLYGLRARSAEFERGWAAQAGTRAEAERVLTARQEFAALSAMGARIDRPQPPWTSLLETLGRIAPGAAVIERVHVQREPSGEWRATLTVEATAFTVSEAARSISEYARNLDLSPLARTEHIEREEGTRRDGDEGLERVRFRIDAQLAPISSQAREATGATGEAHDG